MSNQTQINSNNKNFSLSKIKNLLLNQQKKVEEEIKDLEEDDPLAKDSIVAESSEPGMDSWLADTHSRAVAVKKNLQDMLHKIKLSIARINSGKYGKCESCGNQIEAARLEAMPTATLCISCSKKSKR